MSNLTGCMLFAVSVTDVNIFVISKTMQLSIVFVMSVTFSSLSALIQHVE